MNLEQRQHKTKQLKSEKLKLKLRSYIKTEAEIEATMNREQRSSRLHYQYQYTKRLQPMLQNRDRYLKERELEWFASEKRESSRPRSRERVREMGFRREIERENCAGEEIESTAFTPEIERGSWVRDRERVGEESCLRQWR